MGHPKKKNAAKTTHLRTRQTRSTKGRLILSDPAHNTQLLTAQLSTLGLYPANTVGDGNCLFRALSDQLYGTDSNHARLRQEICDWIEKNGPRYEPFVEDERGLETHLQCMRENATYGGHMELSAFSHMCRRNVKVVQPGLVYVIEWDAGDIPEASGSGSPVASEEVKPKSKRAEDSKPLNPSSGALYVAYHDYEHFSSIRNLRGPHSGLPHVCEEPGDDEEDLIPATPIKKEKVYKAKPKSKGPKRGSSVVPSPQVNLPDPGGPSTPREIPLPPSRSLSPKMEDDSLPLAPFPRGSSALPIGPARTNRSPKRSLEESSAGTSASSESSAKRSRSSRLRPDDNEDVEMTSTPDTSSTPGLSAPGSSSTASSPLSALDDDEAGYISSELSELSDSEDDEPDEIPVPAPRALTPPPVLTRRQRKALVLPKPRVAGGGSGKIIIPGGRYKRPTVVEPTGPVDGTQGEWRTNGTGRMDVRGFRELKI